MSLLVAYALALLVVVVLDGLWLGLVARGLYRREIGDLLLADVRLVPALLFYFGYPLGIVLLALTPRPETLPLAIGRSAGLGLVAYATYELTNLATLKGWSLRLAMIDITWGIVVTSLAGAAAWTLVRHPGPSPA